MVDKAYSKSAEIVLNEAKSSHNGLDTFDAQNRLKKDGKKSYCWQKEKK